MRKLLLLPTLLLAVGCGDTAESLSRDYRNMNNEVVDALMMVTNENRARIANEKILPAFNDHLTAIDKRVDNWEMNKEKEDVARESLTSESVAMLFAENKWNEKRLSLELERLKQLHGQLQAKDPGGKFTNVADLASGSKTSAMLTNMKSGGKFGQLLQKFPGWKLKPETLELKKVLENKIELFKMPN